MGDEARITLSYAGPDLARRANWPAVAGIACSLIFPVAYGLVPHWFTEFRGPTRTEIVGYHVVWAISGLGAAILSLAGLMRSRRLQIRGSRIALIGTILGILNLAGIPGIREYNTERASYWYGVGHSEMRCQANMKSIGQGIMLYANENGGRYPDRLEELILTEEMRPEYFVCPLSNDVPAAGPTTQAIADNLSAGGSLSYVYLENGMHRTAAQNSQFVILYENPTNHSSYLDTLNFLFADGHVDRIPRGRAERMIKRLKAGANPPTD